MADQNTYRAKTAVFAAVSLLPLVDVSDSINGNVTMLDADANPYSQGAFVDGISADVEVTVDDVALAANTAIEVGDNGSLAILYEKRADGRGAAASPNKTHTYGNATVTGRRVQAGAGGRSQVVFSFKCAGVSAGAPVVYS